MPEKNHKVFGFEKFTGEQTTCSFYSPTPFSGASGTGFLTPSSDTRACTLTFCLTHTYTQAFCHTLSIHSSSQIPWSTEDHAAFFRNHSMCHSAWSSGCKQWTEAGPPTSFLLCMPPSSHSKYESFITSRLSPSSKKERKKRAWLMPEVLKEAAIQVCQ